MDDFYFDYCPASLLKEKFGLDQEDVVLRALQKHISLYYLNQTDKVMFFVDSKKSSKIKKTFRYLLFKSIPIDECDKKSIEKGNYIKIEHADFLNLLARNLLSEHELLLTLIGFENKIAYTYVNGQTSKLFNLPTISFNDIYLKTDDVFSLYETLKKEKEEPDTLPDTQSPASFTKETKQTKREKVFLTWLQDKDHSDVAEMKKEDVLEQLRSIDPHLFMGEQKHFFRLQKIIEFKPGRK
ncbi:MULTISPECIES: hypothetical protein [unclassified Neptuniibacter]|uniref:hypothetical protein n=1 Tax=unclassified Neptuniibacter TaxID=2630693 RepID=UPI000C57F937|nr:MULTISPECIES: hypothetical protein [unclassified Neptuniibacter]MAY41901.1 hypothetical protein [Oceanospirillaceae bacterium]|tara:strand:+ start:1485 stop:2204 length:720 start_codon:yes stop_codon:yes gene_type:complete